MKLLVFSILIKLLTDYVYSHFDIIMYIHCCWIESVFLTKCSFANANYDTFVL